MAGRKKAQQQEDTPEETQPTGDGSTKELNDQAEKAMVDAQWAIAEREGLLDRHPESINPDARPK